MMPDEQHQADRLGAYADAWLEGRIGEPESAEEATFARLQRVLGTNLARSWTEPRTIEEEHPMTATISVPFTPAATRPRSPAMVALARWQPAISFAIMLVLIGGLLGIAWDRQMRNPDPSPVMLSALQDDATPSVDGCNPPPASAADDELLAASLSDWPAPVYFARHYADEQTAEDVRAAFTSYLRCLDAGGFVAEDGQALSPEVLAYFSPRMRYLALYDDLTPEQQSEIDTFSCRPKEEEALSNFPILVNNQFLPVSMDGDRYSYYDSLPVYLLGDGRFGMAMGTITTESLRNPAEPVGRDSLGIVTFVGQDGHFYIDESFAVVSTDSSLYSYGQMRGDCD